MNSHRISLHLSRNESPSDSPKDLIDMISSGFSKTAESATRNRENSEQIRTFNHSPVEVFKQDTQEKDIVFYKKLVKQLQKENKELEEKNRELGMIVSDLKPKPGLEKVVRESKCFVNLVQQKNSREVEKYLGGRSEFIGLIKTGNLQEALIRTYTLTKGVMNHTKEGANSGSGSPRSRFANFIEDDITVLKKESRMNSDKINRQLIGKQPGRPDISVERIQEPIDPDDI